MVPKNLFAGQQWRSRNREQTYGHGERRGEERVRCMERVAWELTLPYIKYPMVICCRTQETQTGALYQPEGWGGAGEGREVQEGGDVCIPVADSC